jgi:glycosyltransferase involved in cell wall biosynthesis
LSNTPTILLKEQPLISVIIPAYNRLPLLQQAIESVIAQTYTNWELLIIDDGSTDGTKKAIETSDDLRIRIFSGPHCGNIAALRNAGVSVASGEWVAFLDSDDMWVPEKLERQLQILQQTGRSWSYGRFELMNETGEFIPARSGKYIAHSGWITKELLTSQASVNIGSLMLQRKLFEEMNGFNTKTELILREDYEFALRLSLKAEASAVDELLVKVREHPGRSTNVILDGYKRAAFVYEYFAKNCHDSELKKIARHRQAHHETEMAVKNMQQKKYGQAFIQFSKACWRGDKLRHLLSGFRRSIFTKKEIVLN